MIGIGQGIHSCRESLAFLFQTQQAAQIPGTPEKIVVTIIDFTARTIIGAVAKTRANVFGLCLSQCDDDRYSFMLRGIRFDGDRCRIEQLAVLQCGLKSK